MSSDQGPDFIRAGRRLRAARKAADLTQEALAERVTDRFGIELTGSTISLWESAGAIPTLQNLIPTCRVLGITVGALFDDRDLSLESLQLAYNYEQMDPEERRRTQAALVLGKRDSGAQPVSATVTSIVKDAKRKASPAKTGKRNT